MKSVDEEVTYETVDAKATQKESGKSSSEGEY